MPQELRFKKVSLFSKIKRLNADYVLLDLGAGSSFNTIDFFNLADEGIVILNPLRISIINSNVFLKTALYRKIIQTVKKNKEVWEEISKYLKKEKNEAFDINTVLTWVIQNSKPMVQELRELLVNYKPKFLFNNAKNENVESASQTIIQSARKHLQIDIEYLGSIRFDPNVERSVEMNEMFLLSYPESDAVRDLYDITANTICNNDISFNKFNELPRSKLRGIDENYSYDNEASFGELNPKRLNQ